MHLSRFILSALVAACILAAGALPASAATTVGQTFSPGIDTLPERLNFSTQVATGNSNRVASDGVLTSFSHVAEMTPDATLSFVVMRETATGYEVVGMSDPKVLVAAVLGSWPVRIPVKTGDLIGVYGSTPNLAAASPAPGGNVFTAADPAALATGTVVPFGDFGTFGDGVSGYLLDIAAQHEADADADGFGDETQDGCPGNTAATGACPDITAPLFTLKYSKSVKSTKSVSITLISNEAGSASVSGKFKVGKKSYKIKSNKKAVLAGVRTKLKITVPKKAVGKASKGSIAVTSADAAGNKKTYNVTIKIKKKK